MNLSDKATGMFCRCIPTKLRSVVLGNICHSFPTAFGVEITNICCANCSFCGYRFQQRKKGVMEWTVFKKAIDDYCEIGGGSINLTPTVGEPLLDRNLTDKIRYARSKKNIADIWFYTNLIPLSRSNVDDLLTSGLDILKISTCIKDAETFRELYKVDSYQRVLSNISLICESNARLNNPVSIHLSMRVPKPFSEIKENRDFKSIKSFFKESHIHFFDELYDSWGGRIKERDLPEGYRLFKSKFDMTEEPCYELFRRINVLYDGNVNFCLCRDLNSDLKIGNIMKQSLIDIWRGEDLKRIREDWLKGVVPDMCNGCQRYLPVSDFYQTQTKNIINRVFRTKLLRYVR